MNGNVWKAGAALLFVLILGAYFKDAYDERERVANEIGICERGKLDRIDAAAAWTQAGKTWRHRGEDPALSRGEQELAIETAIVYRERAHSLRTRLLECRPLIEDGHKVIDRPALIEAKGDA